MKNKCFKYSKAAISKLSLKELRELKELVTDEITLRNRQEGNSILPTKLYNIVMGSRFDWKYYNGNYEEEIKKLAELTEKEFSQYRGVGKCLLEYTRTELSKIGLTFKQAVNEME